MSDPLSRLRSLCAPGQLWFPCAALGAAVLAGAILVLIPARLRLLGLWPAVEGLLIGALVGQLAVSRRRATTARVAQIGLIAGSLAFATTSLGWWQWHRQSLVTSTKPDPALAMAANMLAQASETEASDADGSAREFRAGLEQALRERAAAERFSSTFPGWLEHHSAALRPVFRSRSATVRWFLPVCLSVWLIELALAGSVAAWFARRQIRHRPFCSTCGEWLSPVRSHSFTPAWHARLSALLPVPVTEGDIVLTVPRCGCESFVPRVWIESLLATPGRLLEVDQATLSALLALFDEAQGLKAAERR